MIGTMLTFVPPRRRAVLTVAVAALLAAGCSGGGSAAPADPAGTTSSAGSTAPPTDPAAAGGAVGPVRLTLRPVPVSVPAALRQAPFDQTRQLSIPVGWRVSVYARVDKARFMAVTPDGNLLVSQPSTGSVQLVRRGADGVGQVSQFLTGLRLPHDMVFATDAGQTWLYLAQSDQVRRYPYRTGDLTAQPGQTVVSGLPDASTPELGGAYAHALKNIAFGPDGKLYVSIGSSCNVCPSDAASTPRRAAIYRYNATGGDAELFATGLRNAEGLDFVPNTNDLWAVVNNRDNIAYPFHSDSDGNGSDDYGKVLASYVNNHPPELFVHVRPDAFFGWPFCNPNPDHTPDLRNLPFDRDLETNADGHVDCGRATRIDQGIQAHSAPLGLTFLGRTKAPAQVRTGVLVALHGSWNRTRRTGYKVVWFGWDAAAARPTPQQDIVTGFVAPSGQTEQVWGRPVDMAVDQDGSILISDDSSGTIYRLTGP
ncbi:MAG TPA: gluconolaconase [Mycobacteriales bacterium]|nr:gluconolaconase [Mycobacteriales bacterium]